MRTKKSVRDKFLTEAFFGQSSGRCPCGRETCKPNLECTGGLNKGRERAVEAACKEFDTLTKSLKDLCILEESSGFAEAEWFNIGRTFKLVDIEATIEHADDQGIFFIQMLHAKFDILHQEMADMRMIAVGTGNRVATLKATLDQIVRQFKQWAELINCSVCIVQLFNVEKRFGFFEQDCRQLRYQAAAWTDEILEKDPPSLRQMFKDPMNLETVMAREKKPKEHKNRDIKEILKDRGRLSNLATKDTQAMNKQVPDQEIKLPSLPDNLSYSGTRLSAALPVAIRQSVYDLGFLCDDIHQTRAELLRLRDTIQCTLTIWVATSNKAWEYGKKHIHEFSDMRKYEYTRIALRVSYMIAFREEYKILTHFSSDDCPKGLLPNFDEAISRVGRDPDKLHDEWEERVKKLTAPFVPVEELLEQMSPYNATPDATMKKSDEWWSKLQRAPSKK